MRSIAGVVLWGLVSAVAVSYSAAQESILKHRPVGPSLSQAEYESPYAIYMHPGAHGDLPWYNTTSGTLTGLPIGEEGQALVVEGGRPAWGVGGGGGTTTTPTLSQVLTAGGSADFQDVTNVGSLTAYNFYGLLTDVGRLDAGRLIVSGWTRLNVDTGTRPVSIETAEYHATSNPLTLALDVLQGGVRVLLGDLAVTAGDVTVGGTVTAGGAVLTTGTVANAPVNATDIVNKDYADGLTPDITTPTLAQVLGQGNDAGGQDIAGVGDLYTTGTAWAQDVNTTGTVTAGGAALSTGTITHTPAAASDITNVHFVEQQFEQGFVRVVEAGGEIPPIHHYTLNETWESTVVPDWGTAGVDLAATVNASVWSTAGKIGGGFDATSWQRTAMLDDSYGALPETVSVSVWFRVPDEAAFLALSTGGANNVLAGIRTAGGNNRAPHVALKRDGANIIVQGSANAAWGGEYTIPAGQKYEWNHVALVMRLIGPPRPFVLYVNGVQRDSGTNSDDVTSTIGRIVIGRQFTADPTEVNSGSAQIDDFRIYDYAIDADHVARLYNADPATGIPYGTEAGLTSGANVARRSTIVGPSSNSWTSFDYPGHEDEFRTVIGGHPVLTATSDTVTAYRDLHTTGTLWAQDIRTSGTITATADYVTSGDITAANAYIANAVTADTITATTVTATAFVGDGSALTGIYSGELWYALSCEDADVGGYRYLKSNCDNTITIDTVLDLPNPTLVAQWITLQGSPGVRRIPAGVHEIALLASATVGGVSTSRIYATLSIYHPDTTETAIDTSELTPFLTETATQYKIYGILPEIELDVADRIIIRVYGNRGATGSDPTVSLVAGNSSHYAMPDFGASVERFVPYTGAINDLNLGTHSLYAQDVATTGGVTATTVTATTYYGDGSNLTGIGGPTPEAQAYDVLWIGAGAMAPSVTAGADPDTVEIGTADSTYDVFKFPTADDSSVEFDMVFPETWDRGTVKAKAYWTVASGGAANQYVGWDLAATAASNDDALGATLGTAAVVSDQMIAANDLHVSAASAALTIGGTPALGDLIHFRLTRDTTYTGGGTALATDAALLGVLIQYALGEEVSEW